ncbi:MAG: Unknown protein [uncultured Thiotrichaceae bacterium]|uniref:Cell division protein FtsL n=1 Tax=uncultured Thiotrichaceae bacterium TaxID=298394 RepID=A0A6S6TAE5_9GAMM|nr:MAG: Unknown protein [uncultured Thiotrichaceae bacterium]
MSLKLPLLVLLYMAMISMAIQVVMNRQYSRTLFSELQQLELQRDKLTAQWSRLKLEEGTRVNQLVVDKRAKDEMNMHIPRRSQIKVIVE